MAGGVWRVSCRGRERAWAFKGWKPAFGPPAAPRRSAHPITFRTDYAGGLCPPVPDLSTATPEGNPPVLQSAAHILLQVRATPQRILLPLWAPASLLLSHKPARPVLERVRWLANNQPAGRQIYN